MDSENRTIGDPTPLQALIRSRRSIRRFLPDPVDRDTVRICLEAARLAPSAENSQPWRFVVIDDPGLRDRFAKAVFSGIYAPSRFAAAAPVLVLVLVKPVLLAGRLGSRVQGIPFPWIDTGIAGEHFILQAEELALGTCWIGWFDVRRARRFFKIPRRFRIAGLFALGHPASRPPRESPRLPLETIVSFNGFEG